MYRVKLKIRYTWWGALRVLFAFTLLLVTTLIVLTDDRARAIVPDSLSVSSAAVGARQYYLSGASVTANKASSACAAGYHFASIWEIADPSSLKYNTSLGLPSPDSGEGPPTAISLLGNTVATHGWVRTGYTFSVADNVPGHDNCGNWVSSDSFHWGTVANLPSNWTGGEQDIGVWNTELRTCNTHKWVWCVQDDSQSLPEITVSPVSLAFGNQGVGDGPTSAQMVTITNDGNGDLHISSLGLSGADAAEFAIESDSGEDTLTAGGTRTVQLSFDPSSPGAKSASLSIASDDGDEPTVNVTLSGNGLPQSLPEITVSPGSLAFGNQGVGDGPTSAQMVAITNNGNGDLHISSLSLTGTDPTEFAIESDSSQATLTAGGTRTIQLSFDPSSLGAKSANLTIASDDGDEPTVNVALSGNGLSSDNGQSLPEITVSPGSLAFGNQGVGDGPTSAQMVTITNNGNGDLHISNLGLTGTDAAAFAIESDSGQATLTAGGTRTVQLSFDPSSPGAKSANLSIASDDGDEPTVNVTLSGNGLSSDDSQSLPEITVSPGSLAFGNQGVDDGPTSAQMVTITNNGNGDLHISNLGLTGTDAAAFAIESDSGQATLIAGGTRTVQLSFDPSSPGAKSANLSIASDDSDEPTVNVTLSGNGLSSDDWYMFLPLILDKN